MTNEAPKLKLNQMQAETIYALAHNAYENGQYAKAATIFNGLALTKQDNAKYWMGLAASQFMLKKYDKAVQAFFLTTALNPKEPEAYVRAAECLWHLNKKDEALLTLESAEIIASQDKEKNEKLLDQLELYKQAWSNKKKVKG